MNYFLAKTDPDTYSISHLEREKNATWDGVSNPQALKAIRAMRPGDRIFIYHSGGGAAVVGLAEVTSHPRPDPKNARLTVVDMAFRLRFENPVTLSEIKASGLFADWALVRQGRLSTMEAPASFVRWIGKKVGGTNI